MGLRIWRFSTMMSTAVTMSAALAHIMELPAKMRYERRLYVKLHRTLYPTFGKTAGIAEAVAVLTGGVLAGWMRYRRCRTSPEATAAAVSLAAAHGLFWMLVHPANKTMTSWPLDSIPSDWLRWRNQWEYTHAARAVLVTGAVGLLAWSALQE